jgi:hypothetical protein
MAQHHVLHPAHVAMWRTEQVGMDQFVCFVRIGQIILASVFESPDMVKSMISQTMSSFYITWYLSLNDQRLQGSYEDCLRNFYILDEINKSLARANAAGGVQGEGEQQNKSDMASHYAKKFEELYEVFNKRVGGGAGRK